MLTFLRRIRKSLINSGSASRYLLYAIGEILLVMIGILLALQVNNWNQNRVDRSKEKLLLKEIHAEFLSNKKDLTGTLNNYDQARKKYSALIESFPIDPDSYNLDTLSALFRGSNTIRDVDISQGSIATLINSSSFEIISNPELRSLLIQWNDLVADYKKAEYQAIHFTQEFFFPYMDKQVPIWYSEGIKDSRVDLSFLSSIAFENMIKRRVRYINIMFVIAEAEDSDLIYAIDRIIELSAPN